MIESFGLRVRQAMNQVVVGTVMGGAQPVAAALDHEGWDEWWHGSRRRYGAGDLRRSAAGRRSGSAAKDDAGVMKETVQTAVIGVTGYAGAELVRLLLHHPKLKDKPPVFAGRVDEKDVARGGVPLARFILN